MKINTKTALKDITGENLKTQTGDLTLGEVLANIVLVDEGIGKLKGYSLGMKFAQEDEAELDEADMQVLKKAIETTKVYNNLVAGQTLSIINSLK